MDQNKSGGDMTSLKILDLFAILQMICAACGYDIVSDTELLSTNCWIFKNNIFVLYS